jgi:4a-hydroxytetrahydrobiopterin dehydratase
MVEPSEGVTAPVCGADACGRVERNGKGGDMAELLNEDEIASRLRRLPWEREGDEIVREWRFDDFGEAIAFVNRVAEVAEEANHHPDIFIHGWNKVKLALTNHSAGGLTEMDFEMAARFDGLDG